MCYVFRIAMDKDDDAHQGNEENGFSTLIGESQGYLMDVYADFVVLKGVDLVTGSAIPIAQYLLDTKIQEIESKAYSYFSS